MNWKFSGFGQLNGKFYCSEMRPGNKDEPAKVRRHVLFFTQEKRDKYMKARGYVP